MRVVAAALLIASCSASAHEPEQSVRDAIAIACGSATSRAELARRITNREVSELLARDAPPWELGERITELAARTGVAECHPADAVVGIRAPGGVDVPMLRDAFGTYAPEHVPILAITPTGDSRAYVKPGPVVIAADRALAMAALMPRLDALRRVGFSFGQLLVTTPSEPRVVEIDSRALTHDDRPVAITLGAFILVNGEAVAPARLRATLARLAPSHLVIVPEASVTLQQLVDVVAAGNGVAYRIGAPPAPQRTNPQ